VDCRTLLAWYSCIRDVHSNSNEFSSIQLNLRACHRILQHAIECIQAGQTSSTIKLKLLKMFWWKHRIRLHARESDRMLENSKACSRHERMHLNSNALKFLTSGNTFIQKSANISPYKKWVRMSNNQAWISRKATHLIDHCSGLSFLHLIKSVPGLTASCLSAECY
jgi:hypothetical protein